MQMKAMKTKIKDLEDNPPGGFAGLPDISNFNDLTLDSIDDLQTNEKVGYKDGGPTGDLFSPGTNLNTNITNLNNFDGDGKN